MGETSETPTLSGDRAHAETLARAFAEGDDAAVSRVQRVFPGRQEPLGVNEARHVIARERGCESWHELRGLLLDRARDTEWAADAARKAIAENEVGELARLLDEHPALLDWRDPDTGDVLLAATTSYTNFPGIEHEEEWNRLACAELLLDRGAALDPRVTLRIVDTGAPKMMELFAAKGALPRNLRTLAARGRLNEVRGSFDGGGALVDAARPSAELRSGYPEAESHWPEPGDDRVVVADALLYACRMEQRETAELLLERCCAMDADLAARVERDVGRAAFLTELLERSGDGARFGLRRLGPDRPSLVWQWAVELRLHAALHAKDAGALGELLDRERFVLEPPFEGMQVRLIEVAAYSPDARPVLEALFAREPSVARAGAEAPASRAISYALEYGYADYVPLLSRVWPVPDDLPHAAGRGDLERVAKWIGPDGRPALGDPSRHDPFPGQTAVVSVEGVLGRALAWAVQNAEYGVADFLLDHGADIQTRWGTHEPASILHECAAAGRMEQVRYLVGKGADVGMRDPRFDATAADWAEFGGHDEVARYLGSLG